MAYHEAILDTLTLYNYDNTIFKSFHVPTGMNRQNVIDTILLETAELSVIYPSPDALKQAIGIWCKKNLEIWNKLYETLHYEYNPIHNYDKTEYGLDVIDGKELETRNLVNEDEYERNLNDKTNIKNKIAAFNEGLGDSSESDNSTDYTGNSKDTKKDTGTINNKTDNNNSHYLRGFGNIGVMSTQELIERQRDTVQFNLTDYIVTDYKKTFCVAVY